MLEVDEGDGGTCIGIFVRIRVSLNIKLHLKQCLWIQNPQGPDNIYISLVYEKATQPFALSVGSLAIF